jgi:hypothetical protein
MSIAPTILTVTRRIKRFTPLYLGKIMGLCYGVMGLVICPLPLLMARPGRLCI